jgi:hypothetical protein
MLDRNPIHNLNALIRGVLRQPIRPYRSKRIPTFTTPIMRRIFNIGPAVSRESGNAGFVYAEGRVGQEAHLVGLGSVVLVALGF